MPRFWDIFIEDLCYWLHNFLTFFPSKYTVLYVTVYIGNLETRSYQIRIVKLLFLNTSINDVL